MDRTISQVVAVCLIFAVAGQPATPLRNARRHVDPRNAIFEVDALASRPGTFSTALTSASRRFFTLAATVAAGTGLWALHPHLSAPILSVQAWMTIFSGVGIWMTIAGDPSRKKAGLDMNPFPETPLTFRDSFKNTGIPSINPYTVSEGIEVLRFLRLADIDQIIKTILAAVRDPLRQIPNFEEDVRKIVKALMENRPGPQETLEDVGHRMGLLLDMLIAALRQGSLVITAPAVAGSDIEPSIVLAGPETLRHLSESQEKVRRRVKNPEEILKLVRLGGDPLPKLPREALGAAPLLFTGPSLVTAGPKGLMHFLDNADEIDFANAMAAAAESAGLLQMRYFEEILIKLVRNLAQRRPGPTRTFENSGLNQDLFFGFLLDAQRQGLMLITAPAVRRAVTDLLLSNIPLSQLIAELEPLSPSTTFARRMATIIQKQGMPLEKRTGRLWGRDSGIFPWVFAVEFVEPKIWLQLVNRAYKEAYRISKLQTAGIVNRGRALLQPA